MVEFFATRGIESVHWSDVGNPMALDPEIMVFARENRYVVFTHDLDFGNILAVTHARGPSVIQARVEESMERVAQIFGSFEDAEMADDQFYADLTPEERLNILLELVERHRIAAGEAASQFERVHRVVDLSES